MIIKPMVLARLPHKMDMVKMKVIRKETTMVVIVVMITSYQSITMHGVCGESGDYGNDGYGRSDGCYFYI